MDKNIISGGTLDSRAVGKNVAYGRLSVAENSAGLAGAENSACGSVSTAFVGTLENPHLTHGSIPLTYLENCGVIVSLSPSLEKRVSRRLEDLGFTSGEKIRRMMGSAFGGCAAYIIKGSVIVLRDSTASRILVNFGDCEKAAICENYGIGGGGIE